MNCRKRFVACPAALMMDDQIIVGEGHFTPDMCLSMIRWYGEDYKKQVRLLGFIDQYGIFMNRLTAWTVAREAEQIFSNERTGMLQVADLLWPTMNKPMTHHQKRTALAKAIAQWRIADETGMSALVHWVDEKGAHMLSDPFDDLNACAAMEKALTDEQYLAFGKALILSAHNLRTDAEQCRATVSATAEQRIDAVGKVLNLW